MCVGGGVFCSCLFPHGGHLIVLNLFPTIFVSWFKFSPVLTHLVHNLKKIIKENAQITFYKVFKSHRI